MCVAPTLRALQERGVLALPSSAVTVRLLPPLVWERAQADELLAALGVVLG